jgi:hypothetical protein
MKKAKGLYLGTEINEKWWKRYKKDKMFARGNGEYWFKADGLYFHRYLTKMPIFIPFSSMLEIKLGKWHAGQWGMGVPILKVIWKKDELNLCSGFMVSKRREDTLLIKGILENYIDIKGVIRSCTDAE